MHAQHVFLYTHVCMCVYICMRTQRHVCLYTHTYMCIAAYARIHMHACVRARLHARADAEAVVRARELVEDVRLARAVYACDTAHADWAVDRAQVLLGGIGDAQLLRSRVDFDERERG